MYMRVSENGRFFTTKMALNVCILTSHKPFRKQVMPNAEFSVSQDIKNSMIVNVFFTFLFRCPTVSTVDSEKSQFCLQTKKSFVFLLEQV